MHVALLAHGDHQGLLQEVVLEVVEAVAAHDVRTRVRPVHFAEQ